MYLMKVGADVKGSTTDSILKIPKGQILSEIEQGVVADDKLSASVSIIPICLEDTTLNGNQRLPSRIYTQKIIQKITYLYYIKNQTLYFLKDGNGNWYLDSYWKRDLSTGVSELVDKGKQFLLSRAELQAHNKLKLGEQGGEVFKFLVNPQNINFSYVKSNTKVLTSAGWSFQHWGNDVPVIDVKGTTLMLKSDNPVVGNNWEKDPVTAGKVYQNLATLRSWYWEQNIQRNPVDSGYRIGLYYRGTTYIGHFDDFSFTEDAEKPRVLDYSFKFTVEEERGDGALLGGTKDIIER